MRLVYCLFRTSTLLSHLTCYGMIKASLNPGNHDVEPSHLASAISQFILRPFLLSLLIFSMRMLLTLVQEDKLYLFYFYSFLCYEMRNDKREAIPLANITRLEKRKPISFLPGSGMSLEVTVIGFDKVNSLPISNFLSRCQHSCQKGCRNWPTESPANSTTPLQE